MGESRHGRTDGGDVPKPFRCDLVERIRREDNIWERPGGQLLLPRVFGFCRGVERALALLERAVDSHARGPARLFLLGEIIHHPWVNAHYRRRGVRILHRCEMDRLAEIITPRDCAVIPAFGVPPPVQRQLGQIGCEIVDTSCGDVRRLWRWATRAVGNGFGVLIFGRADHDETAVTKLRLAEAGGEYLVLGRLEEVGRFCDMIAHDRPTGSLGEHFGPQATNAESIAPFTRLAQVSQTTMLHEDTMAVRRLIHEAFVRRFGQQEADERLAFEPTVCRATQDRQNAAVELCRSGLDLVIVVGGFGSSNTRHLYELARGYCPAFFVEDAEAIVSADVLRTFDPAHNELLEAHDWLPARRPLRIGLLAGASCPEAVVGDVLRRLAEFLS